MDNPTLTIHWLFSAISLLIMGLRLTWRKVARQDFNLGDYVTMAAIVCCVTRAGLIHVVLTWGTSNIPAAVRASHTFTEEEIYQREVGSKLSIVNRFFYNS
jgi:NhaP-type Na+/H+ or K+/H+ antiporter